MSGRKIVLLLAILAAGGLLEGAFSLRGHFELGPSGCRVHPGRFVGPSYSFEERRELPFPAGGTLRLTNAFGSVSVRGVAPAGQARVLLRKTVFAPSEARARELAERVKLEVGTAAGPLELSTNRRDLEESALRESGLETHFEVELPADASLVVKNEYGPASVSGLAAVEADNAFESLSVEDVAGAVKLQARHADVEARRVRGALSVVARHGQVSLGDVAAVDVDLQQGDLRVEQAGACVVRHEHGSAHLSRLSGDLRFEGRNSDLEAQDLSGAARLETSGEGFVLRRVQGAVSVQHERGDLRLEDLGGGLTLKSAFADLTLERVAGRVDLSLERGELRAEELSGGGRVVSESGDVSLLRFRGAYEVETRRGALTLEPAGPLAEALSARSRHGDLRLVVAPGSSFELNATAEGGGEVSARDLPGLELRSSSPERLEGRVGSGGARVELKVERGQLTLERGGE